MAKWVVSVVSIFNDSNTASRQTIVLLIIVTLGFRYLFFLTVQGNNLINWTKAFAACFTFNCPLSVLFTDRSLALI